MEWDRRSPAESPDRRSHSTVLRQKLTETVTVTETSERPWSRLPLIGSFSMMFLRMLFTSPRRG
ncbi:hypothetical protein TPA0908_40750 [Micromonospora sp. AKA38]|nr:hypothetical protein TPA0908_40750 [Micromonospora sp. AKA38]